MKKNNFVSIIKQSCGLFAEITVFWLKFEVSGKLHRLDESVWIFHQFSQAAPVLAFEDFAVSREIRYQHIPDFQYVAFDHVLIVGAAADFLGHPKSNSQHTISKELMSLRN